MFFHNIAYIENALDLGAFVLQRKKIYTSTPISEVLYMNVFVLRKSNTSEGY